MTSDRFNECLQIIHWTEHTLAAALGCEIAVVEAWATGEEEVPPKLAAWLHALALAHQACEDGRPRAFEGKRRRD